MKHKALENGDIRLLDAAESARGLAYAPYSEFAVGAALKTGNGDVVRGCNVENISYGLTICAERVAVGAAVAMGVTQFSLLAIVSDSSEPVVPCGACRQVLAEFAPELRILSRTTSGITAEYLLADLLPLARRGIMS